MSSKRLTPAEKRELQQLRAEKQAGKLSQSAGHVPDSLTLAALAGLPSDAHRRQLLERLTAKAKAPNYSDRSDAAIERRLKALKD